MKEQRGERNRKIFDPTKDPEDSYPWGDYKKQCRNKNKHLTKADDALPQVAVERVLRCISTNGSKVSAQLTRLAGPRFAHTCLC